MSGARIEAVVDLDAIRHNVALLAGLAGRSGASTMAVVKADGYGHGAVEVARAALDGGRHLARGVHPRGGRRSCGPAGSAAPMLSWLHVARRGHDRRRGHRGRPVGIASPRDLDAAAGAARAAGRPARVHLKIDTGLSRNGCPPADWGGLARRGRRPRRRGRSSSRSRCGPTSRTPTPRRTRPSTGRPPASTTPTRRRHPASAARCSRTSPTPRRP